MAGHQKGDTNKLFAFPLSWRSTTVEKQTKSAQCPAQPHSPTLRVLRMHNVFVPLEDGNFCHNKLHKQTCAN